MNQTINTLLNGPQYPDKEFVRSGATFAEVYAMAAWLRTALNQAENQGTAICLTAENKAIMAAAILASLAGGPSLLLPYAFSKKALARMQLATGFTHAISDVTREFPEVVQVLCPQAGGSSALPVSPQASPQDELLKIFTGGSTGSPQAWSKTGANICNEAFYLARQFDINQHDCIVATIPPYHIYGLLFSVILPLVSSAQIIAGAPSFPGEIVETIQRDNCTILASVPPHYRVLRDRAITGSSLRLAFSSAGMLDSDDNRAFCTTNKVGIFEVYGSTETGGIATRNRFLGEDNFTPLQEVDWKIIDQRLAVRSPYLSPELPVDEEKFFITGDRTTGQGAKGFLLQGRIDGVTKVGGKRVDLEEIRTLITKQTGVSDCVVMALPEPGGREHRIAVLIQGTTANRKAIKAELKHSLEPYALPRSMKVVEQIPLQKNGKYDRAAVMQLLTT